MTFRNIRFGELAGGAGSGVEVEELTYSDDTNKVFGPLSSSVSGPENSLMFYGTLNQLYIQDFTLRLVIGGSAPGWYVCISTSSTAPGGGGFSGSQNPATGLNDVEIGDKINLLYQPSI